MPWTKDCQKGNEWKVFRFGWYILSVPGCFELKKMINREKKSTK